MKIITAILSGIAAISLGACSHPVALESPDDHIVELAVVNEYDSLFAHTINNRSWHGSLAIKSDSLYSFIIEEFGGHDHDEDNHDDHDHGDAHDDHDHEDNDHDHEHEQLVYKIELSDSTKLTSTQSENGFTLSAATPGDYKIRIVLWHGSHIDLITPWLEVQAGP